MSDETIPEETINLVKNDDSFLALCILCSAAVLVVFIGIYLWKNKMFSSGGDNRLVFTCIYVWFKCPV